jgi:hypothetical protein
MSFSVFFCPSVRSEALKVFLEIHYSGGRVAKISVQRKYDYKRRISPNTLHEFVHAYWRSSRE